MKNIAKKNGYYFNTESEKLEKFELVKAEFTLAEGTPVRYYCKLGGVDAVVESEDLVLYESEAAFKTGYRMAWTPLEPRELRNCMPIVHQLPKNKTWAFRNGKAEFIEVDDILLVYENGVFSVASGEKFYTSTKSVYMYNDYVVKEADGSERKVECVASKMALTDKQKELVERLNAIAREMYDAGLYVAYESDYGRIIVANNANTKDMRLDYEELEGYEDVSDFTVATDFDVAYRCCDDSLYAIFE
jgi:hypothetical protein